MEKGEVNRFSRRNLLKAAAATGSIGLVAGCSGGDGNSPGGNESDGGDTTQNGGQGGDQMVDEWLVLPHFKNMEKIQFNLWNPTRNTGFERHFLWDEMTHFLPTELEYSPVIATDWSREGSTATVSIREGLSWHSGQSLGAQDVINHFRLGELTGYPVWDYVDEVQAADEHTVEFSLGSGDVNTAILFDGILGSNEIATHPELHKEFLDRLEDATSDDAREQLQSDLVSHTIPPEDAIETVGNGPVKITEANNQVLTLEPHEDYPIGWEEDGQINFNGVKSRNFGTEVSAIYQAVASDRADIYRSTPPANMREQFADHWDRTSYPTFGGQAIFFSPKSIFGKNTERSRKLRKAIAHWYNPKTWAEVYGEEQTTAPKVNNVTGLAGPQDESWIAGNVELTNYGNADTGWRQADKANQLMKDAGFEKNGNGKWVDTETNEVLSAPLKFPAGWTDGVPGYQNAAEQLNNFGIDCQPSGQEVNAILGGQLPNDDFQLAMVSYGGGPHPHAAFRSCLGSLSSSKWSYRNKLETLSVPWPVGNPDGDLKEINVNERIKQLAVTTDEEEEQRLVEELAWTVNQWVPFVEAETRSREIGFATDNWDWGVAKDSPEFSSDQPWSYLLRTGNLTAKK